MTNYLKPRMAMEDACENTIIRYFIESRPGVRGGEVSWARMARHLDLRTLAFYKAPVYVLYMIFSVEECIEIARFME